MEDGEVRGFGGVSAQKRRVSARKISTGDSSKDLYIDSKSHVDANPPTHQPPIYDFF